MELRNLKHSDPLKRSADKQSDSPEYSPMDPPDAYSPPAIEEIPYDNMPVFIQKLMDDHQEFRKELELLEEVLGQLREKGLGRGSGVEEALSSFFAFMDERILTHHLKEERVLFPLLQQRLIEKGQRGVGDTPRTAVDILEDDHSKGMQLAAVTFNFLGLAARLPDARSRAIVLDAALEQGRALIELLRLHMFREDTLVFVLAAKYLEPDELSAMERAAIQCA